MFSGYGCDRSCDQGDVNYEIEYVGGGARQSRVSATCLPHYLARAVPLSRCLALWAMARALAPVHALSRAHHTVCGHAAPSARASVVQPLIETTRLYDARVGYYTVRMLTAHPCTSRTHARRRWLGWRARNRAPTSLRLPARAHDTTELVLRHSRSPARPRTRYRGTPSIPRGKATHPPSRAPSWAARGRSATGTTAPRAWSGPVSYTHLTLPTKA